ncbi:hypothetical protein LT679_01880 [Mucilaginibacter roseus]|uniref:TerB family tellurite resistance protein n=1 Tax=Mucilaginibacter roseus TaxID=1528868 RepID=A0ABS8TZU3_9SPHI|nr:hypothetical protein [Mucilaginibacter roseus]MCD8739338.1 hypothetical protein [Mucilaginibacter roseus]
MACIKLTILALLLGGSASAQTFAEWFSQKKTQKKYLMQQIAALQMYSGYLSKGYKIAKGGLGNIGGYIGDEFMYHGNYYTHLKTVNALVKSNPQVKQILRWQQDIIHQATAIKRQDGLTAKEQVYLGKVTKSLLTDCDARLNDLETVITNNKAEMSDEERIRQIALICKAMEDNYKFVTSFNIQVKLYVRNKALEKKDANLLTQLYENH